jgi:hypothetical protein
MTMRAGQNAKNNSRKDKMVSGFLGGLNTFQDETLIKDSELSEAKNIILSVDGISPRPGTITYGTGNADNRIDGLTGYYKSDGTREMIRMSGGALRKQSSGALVDIDTSFTSGARTFFIQALDKLFIVNASDGLSQYDGTTLNKYTALTTPTGGSVAPQGTAQTTSYAYKVAAFNFAGETLATANLTTNTGNATLSATNFNRVTWNAVSNAEGYNIYGRKADGKGVTYLDTVYTTTYDDKNQRSPASTLFPPEANNTGGIKATMLAFGISRIFAAGDPANPSRLYYSDTGTKVGNFNISLDSNAGFVDVFKNDGFKITSIIPFQGGVIVFKENAIFKFDFVQASGDFDGDGVEESVSLPQLSEITRSFGCISFRSTQYVENDVIFAAKKDGRLAFYSLGNQENYAGNVLRTNELSIKVQEKLEDVNVDYLENASGFYYNNIYGCSMPTNNSSVNNRIWCLDTRFGAWTYWEDLKPATFVTFNGSDGTQKLYFGEDDGGDVVEMFKEDRNDDGQPIEVRFSTKSFNQDQFYIIKKFKDPVFQFKDVNKSGLLSGEIYVDGSILQGGFTVNQQIGGGAGVGFDLPGFALVGDAGGTIDNTIGISADIIVEVKKIVRGRAIKFNFKSDTINLNYKFLSLAFRYYSLPGKRLPQSTRFYATG